MSAEFMTVSVFDGQDVWRSEGILLFLSMA